MPLSLISMGLALSLLMTAMVRLLALAEAADVDATTTMLIRFPHPDCGAKRIGSDRANRVNYEGFHTANRQSVPMCKLVCMGMPVLLLVVFAVLLILAGRLRVSRAPNAVR